MNTMTLTAKISTPGWLAASLSSVKKSVTGVADVAAVVVPAIFILGTAGLESVQTGYSRITDTVSMLVWGSNGWLESVLFCLNGLFFILFALRLYRASRDMAGKAGVAMLALAGVSFFIIAVCPTLAPGAEPSFTSQVHEYTARGISSVFPLACFLLALSWRNNPANKTISNWTIAFGVIGLALNLIGLLYVTGDIEWIGALERLIILNGFAWLGVLGLHFCHTSHGMHAPCCVHIEMAATARRIGLALKDISDSLLPEPGLKVPVYSRSAPSNIVPHPAGANHMYITGKKV